MKILKNQTIYQCEYCKKRLLSKNGARLHENHYCWQPLSPNQKAIKKKQEECTHENSETIWSYIPGETVKQPDHDLCLDCGVRL